MLRHVALFVVALSSSAWADTSVGSGPAAPAFDKPLAVKKIAINPPDDQVDYQTCYAFPKFVIIERGGSELKGSALYLSPKPGKGCARGLHKSAWELHSAGKFWGVVGPLVFSDDVDPFGMLASFAVSIRSKNGGASFTDARDDSRPFSLRRKGAAVVLSYASGLGLPCLPTETGCWDEVRRTLEIPPEVAPPQCPALPPEIDAKKLDDHARRNIYQVTVPVEVELSATVLAKAPRKFLSGLARCTLSP